MWWVVGQIDRVDMLCLVWVRRFHRCEKREVKTFGCVVSLNFGRLIRCGYWKIELGVGLVVKVAGLET